MINTIQLISSCQDKILSLDRMIPVKEYSMRIEEIDELSSNPDIWNDPKRAAALMKERQKLADLLTKLNFFKEQSAFYAEFASLAGNEKTLCKMIFQNSIRRWLSLNLNK